MFVLVSEWLSLHSFCADGFDRVDPNDSSTALKNQVVGLLQAVGYLKGMKV
jgi:hypothetical protein